MHDHTYRLQHGFTSRFWRYGVCFVILALAYFHHNGFTIFCASCHKKGKEVFFLPTFYQERSEAGFIFTPPVMDLYSSGEEVVVKTRKPYTKTKQRERWTEDEHNRFLEALKLYGRAWQHIEEHIGAKLLYKSGVMRKNSFQSWRRKLL
ncbi:hypothetical protein RYX36_014936 [Vicia faba]